jgi:hypothetical protein
VTLGDDLLACVLGGVYTDVEKTLIEIQRTTMVQETRRAFQNAMQDKLINAVQRLSGRHVLAFFSDHLVGPDIQIELFLLTPGGTTWPPITCSTGSCYQLPAAPNEVRTTTPPADPAGQPDPRQRWFT